ncbi:MAG: hypothetical protein QG622_2397 [Actinomycetota bacterium]|nr:hypothetical protein [Actinomycetota bacterium]
MVGAACTALLSGACLLHGTGPTALFRRPASGAGATSAAGAGATAARTAVLVGAGDIGSCVSSWDSRTADLLTDIDGTIFTAGDNSQDEGTHDDFAECFGPTWGRFKSRIRPVPGNHDYLTENAEGYFDYFGRAAGPEGRGYYSYDAGDWHVVALNSNCSQVSCAKGSAQERWLRADLGATEKTCTAAFWHHSLFTSSDGHHAATETLPLFQALYDHGAEIVVSGHNHVYERFAPQNPRGERDDAHGIRQFTVGTGGGGGHYGFGEILPNSQVHDDRTFGVLKLTLKPGSYDWRFVPVEAGMFTDSGTGSCH